MDYKYLQVIKLAWKLRVNTYIEVWLYTYGYLIAVYWY